MYRASYSEDQLEIFKFNWLQTHATVVTHAVAVGDNDTTESTLDLVFFSFADRVLPN